MAQIRAFNNIDQILNITEWNTLASKSQTPYYFKSFIEQFINSAIKSKQKPMLIVYYSEHKTVGIAPVAISSEKGLLRTASFLTGPDFDPDFVVEEKYREQFIHETIDFLFKKIGCTLIDFVMPSETKNLAVLEGMSKFGRGPYHLIRPSSFHSVVCVEGTWAEFERRRGRNYRKIFRSIEKRMSLNGGWRIEFVSNQYSITEVEQYLLEIEKESWKQTYRLQRGIEKDDGLIELFTAATGTQLTTTGFQWEVAFLEVNGKKIAYSFWFEYKDTAFICKTSFDDRYKKYYPGMYINNAVIREVFKNPAIKQIDLMTDLPFHDRWAPKKVPRTRILISKSPIPIAIAKTTQNQYVMQIRRRISKVIKVNLPYLPLLM